MRDDGKAIVIITHKMHEVKSLSDRVAVLRGGRYIGSLVTKDTDVNTMTDMMVGHAVQLNIERPDPVDPKPRIEVEGLTIRNEEGIVKLKDVSFTANSGEILGIAGISGCGQKELLEAIAGLQPIESGTINYIEPDGSKEMLIGKDPLKIAEMGVSLSFVPEDRLGMGLVGNMDLTDNMMLPERKDSVCKSETVQKAGRKCGKGSGSCDTGYHYSGPQTFWRKCTEGIAGA